MARKADETKKEKQNMAKSGTNGHSTAVAPVHLMLQSKGGVGKTTCCAFLAEYIIDAGKDLVLLDMDPRNASLSKYKGLPVESVDIFDEGAIDPAKTTRFFSRLIEADRDKTVVVDTGATTFEAMMDFLIKQEVVEEFWTAGRPLYLHTVVCSGGSSRETLSTFMSLAENVTSRQNLVVWLNEMGEHLEFAGKTFADTKGFQSNQGRVAATVLVEWEKTKGLTLDLLLKGKMTFKEAERTDQPSMEYFYRRNVPKIRASIYEQLSKGAF